jgi:glycosyltransferase A (GT-A) superfamily protein (DUF2064 family)
MVRLLPTSGGNYPQLFIRHYLDFWPIRTQSEKEGVKRAFSSFPFFMPRGENPGIRLSYEAMPGVNAGKAILLKVFDIPDLNIEK